MWIFEGKNKELKFQMKQNISGKGFPKIFFLLLWLGHVDKFLKNKKDKEKQRK